MKELHSGLKEEVFGQPLCFQFHHFLRVLIWLLVCPARLWPKKATAWVSEVGWAPAGSCWGRAAQPDPVSSGPELLSPLTPPVLPTSPPRRSQGRQCWQGHVLVCTCPPRTHAHMYTHAHTHTHSCPDGSSALRRWLDRTSRGHRHVSTLLHCRNVMLQFTARRPMGNKGTSSKWF